MDVKTHRYSFTLPLYGDDVIQQYAVRRIIGIGRNYPEHAKEMGKDPTTELPFFFYKPLTALCDASKPITWTLPAYSRNVHHELEVSVAIGSAVTANNVEQGIVAAGLALDMTCRDIQQNAKSAGRPWETAKGFDLSAPCSGLQAIDWQAMQKLGEFRLKKNNTIVQRGYLEQMIWKLPDLIRELSKFTRLDYGDIILTGTPAGVGPLISGDHLEASMDGLSSTLDLTILS